MPGIVRESTRGTAVALVRALEHAMKLSLVCAAAVTVLPALTLSFTPTSSHSASSATAAPMAPSGARESHEALVGTYDCQGVEPDGTPYQGIVQIIAHRGSYEVIWSFGSGQQYGGVGVVNGDVLAVSYFTNRPGVVAYKIEQGEKGPRLQGQWTVIGAGKVFHETLTRVTSEVRQMEPPPRPAPTPIPRHLRPA
jgi:hypothetical protein